MKKKILLLSAAVIALAAVCVIGYTLAYFTDEATKTNEFTVGNIALELREPAWDGANFSTAPLADEPDLENLGIYEANPTMPGDVILKNPMVKNTGNNEFYVRLLVTIDNYAAFNAIEGYTVTDLFDNSFSTDWALYGDGLGVVVDDTVTYEFRYVGTLAPGVITDPLFTHIKIPTTIDDEFNAISDVEITVKAQAIQVDNLTETDAFDALDVTYPVEP